MSSLLKHVERWRDITGFEGLYQISTLGRVKSLGNGNSNNSNNSKERILKQRKNTAGYLQVCLYKDGKVKTYYVHRLVAKAFIPNPLNLPCVNHKTEDKTMNYVWCLEYCDHKYNSNYGTAIKRRVEKVSKKVICVENGIIYPSVMEAGRQTETNSRNIFACLKGRRKTAGKLHWKYVD